MVLGCLTVSFAGCPGEEGHPPPPIGPGTPPPPVATDGSDGAETAGGETDSGQTDGDQVDPPDVSCHLLTEVECSANEKCVPVGAKSPLGYTPWTRAVCRPLETVVRTIGQPCTASEGLSEGYDNCERGSICYSSDVDDGQGRCTELCADGSCTSGTCVVDNAGHFPICLGECDPLTPTCGTGEGCLPSGTPGGFACHVIQSSALSGACAMKNGCGAGAACVPAELADSDSPYASVFGYMCAQYCALENPHSCSSEGDTCVSVPSFQSNSVGICGS